MATVDLTRGFTVARKDGSEATYVKGLNEIDPRDRNHFMVVGLTVKPGERVHVPGATATVEADPTPGEAQGEVAPVGQEDTGKMAVPTGGGSSPKVK